MLSCIFVDVFLVKDIPVIVMGWTSILLCDLRTEWKLNYYSVLYTVR